MNIGPCSKHAKNDFRSLAHQQEAGIWARVNDFNMLSKSKESKATEINMTASPGAQTVQVPSRTWIVQAGQDWHDPDAQGSREFEISSELWKELLETRYFPFIARVK